jgi:hypothetical protein
MKKRNLGLGLLGTGAVFIGVILILMITPVGSAMTPAVTPGAPVASGSAHLALKFRSVAVGGDCLDYGKGAPCNPCELSGSMTNADGNTVLAVCSDVLTAVGAKQTWHAHYYVSSSLGSGAININETSGTLYAGQSMQFIFGIEYGCAVGYNPDILTIVGPSSSVEIGFGGCG